MSGIRQIIQLLRRGLRERRNLPPREIARRIWRSGVAMVAAQQYLRGCDSVGARARIVGHPLIANHGTMMIGDDLTLNCTVAPVQMVSEAGGKLVIGDGVSLNFGVVITSRLFVHLGDRVRVGPFGIIADTDVPLPDMDALRAARLVRTAPVVIKNDVWLGARVTVLAGSCIGEGSVIGAGSVVVGDIPAGVIASGNPARVIRQIADVQHD